MNNETAEFEAIKAELAGFKGLLDKDMDSKLEEFQKQLDAFDLKAKERPMGGGRGMSTKDQIDALLAKNVSAINATASNGAKISMKADASIITTGNMGAGVVLGNREPGINEAPRRRRFILSIINTMSGGPGSNPLTWIEWRPGNGGPAGVAESATKPGLDWTYQEGKQSAEVIAVTAATTKQALLNMAELSQQINDELLGDLYDELDYQILKGDGTGANLKGIDQFAKAFTGSTLAGEVDEPNIFDVIRAATLQVRKGNSAATGYARRTGYVANYAIVSPTIAAQMDLIKDTQGRYILPPFRSNDGQMVGGVQIIDSDFADDDEFFVGDFTKSLFNFVEGVTIQTGWINDQFVKNQLSIRAEVMGTHRIKYHDGWAFVKGDFTTAKALIQKTT
jgi:HK97 family phage major capsid protein